MSQLPQSSPRAIPTQPRLHRFFKETRTRILLMYALLMLVLTGLSIPFFRFLLFQQIEKRVRADLNRERLDFLDAYLAWEAAPNQTLDDFQDFIDDYLDNKLPEDDNFHIIIFNDQKYRSNPDYLPEPFQPNSALFRSWRQVTEFMRGDEPSGDPDIGRILYKAEPLRLEGKQQGIYVVAHTAAGERQESLVGVYLFSGMIAAIVGLSLLLSWLGAGRLMAPIQALSTTARSIQDSDLTGRISAIEGTGELADLVDTFNAMLNRIQQAFDSQRAFINDAGHELRTPITIIRGHLELLDDDPQDRQETVALVIDELDRMGRLVNDMILLAKSEQDDFLHLETIEVGALTEELFAKARTLAPRNWVLEVEGHGHMVGDRQRLTGALLNLLRNATQHTQINDTIALGCRLKQRAPKENLSLSALEIPQRICVQFWVRDTGRGISVTDQQRIFNRFSRGQNLKRQSEGSGLGLAIVSAVVEAHGGSIELVSQLGQGSTFELTLPMDQP